MRKISELASPPLHYLNIFLIVLNFVLFIFLGSWAQLIAMMFIAINEAWIYQTEVNRLICREEWDKGNYKAKPEKVRHTIKRWTYTIVIPKLRETGWIK